MITLTGQAFLNKIEGDYYNEQKLFIQHLQETLIYLGENATIQIYSNRLILTFRNYRNISEETKDIIEERWAITENKTKVGENQFNYSYTVKFK